MNEKQHLTINTLTLNVQDIPHIQCNFEDINDETKELHI